MLYYQRLHDKIVARRHTYFMTIDYVYGFGFDLLHILFISNRIISGCE